MFFDPSDYLHGDPDEAASEREAKRLRREAKQRAKLCRAMTAVTAKRGYEGASIHETVGLAGYGKATYYKLFPTKEACLLEAFERCGDAIVAAVEEAIVGASDPVAKAEAGLGTLVEALAAHRDVARVALVEIRVAGAPCREAQQRWLGRFEGLLQNLSAEIEPEAEAARLAVGAVSTILALEVAAGRTKKLPKTRHELLDAVAMGCPGRRRWHSTPPSAEISRASAAPPQAEVGAKGEAMGGADTSGPIDLTTAKEKLLERVAKLSEAEADEALRLLDANEGPVLPSG